MPEVGSKPQETSNTSELISAIFRGFPRVCQRDGRFGAMHHRLEEISSLPHSSHSRGLQIIDFIKKFDNFKEIKSLPLIYILNLLNSFNEW